MHFGFRFGFTLTLDFLLNPRIPADPFQGFVPKLVISPSTYLPSLQILKTKMGTFTSPFECIYVCVCTFQKAMPGSGRPGDTPGRVLVIGQRRSGGHRGATFAVHLRKHQATKRF